ncbi:MAG: ABC transporter substrate-binding protein [Desulfovibrionaceae bacterium]|nr:ABC transporter substrate-binding protein [Desulfovibrionaceae bacterium]
MIYSVRQVLAHENKIRIGSLQNDLHHLPLWVAIDQGFFQEAGVNVELTATFRAGPELINALVSKSIDMGYVGEAPATIGHARGNTDLVFIAQVNTGGSALVVRKNSPIKTVADLVGRRVAVPGNGTVQDFLLRRTIIQEKIKPSDLKIITLHPSEMLQALEEGQIDAFIAWQPYPARAIVHGQGQILADSNELWPNHPCCCLVSHSAFLDNGLAAKVVLAHKKAINYILTNPEEALKIAQKKTGMALDEIREAIKHVTYQAEAAIAGEEEYVNFLNNLKYIKVDLEPFLKSFIRMPE